MRDDPFQCVVLLYTEYVTNYNELLGLMHSVSCILLMLLVKMELIMQLLNSLN